MQCCGVGAVRSKPSGELPIELLTELLRRGSSGHMTENVMEIGLVGIPVARRRLSGACRGWTERPGWDSRKVWGRTRQGCGVGLSRDVRSPAKVTPRNMGNGADCLGNAWLLVWALVVNGHNSGEYVPCIYCCEVKEDLLLFKAWETLSRDSGLQNLML